MAYSRTLAVIVFSDIVGYSSLMEKSESKALDQLKKNRKLHRKLLKKYNGKWLKEMGDGILMRFSTISEAVYFAGEIINNANSINLNLRIGIHLGEVEIQGKDIFGEGVNIASRLESLASKNQILVSDIISKNIQNKEDFESHFLGENKLKNIEDAIRVYSISVKKFPDKSITEWEWKNRHTYVAGIVGFLMIIAWYILPLESSNQKKESYNMVPLTSSSSALLMYPTFSPDGSMMSYSKYDTKNIDIVSRSRGGLREVKITNTPHDEFFPRYSPDGTKISYLYLDNSGVDLYWIPASGGKEKLLISTGLHMLEQSGEIFFGIGANPWSLDSKKVLFPKLNSTGGIAIWEINIETGSLKQITFPDSGVVDISASYSKGDSEVLFSRNFNIWASNYKEEFPIIESEYTCLNPIFLNEQEIIFNSNKNGSFDVWKINRENKNITQLTNTKSDLLYPIISPQNTLVCTEWYHLTDLIVIDTETGEIEQLTSHIGNNFFPVVSPDGDKVAYQSNRTGNNEIWVFDMSDGSETLISNHPGNDINPSWSPDGSKLVFLSNRSGEYHLWLADTTGNLPVQLSMKSIELSSYSYDYSMKVDWSPDGNKIGFIAKSKFGRSMWSINVDGSDQKVEIGAIHNFSWFLDSNTILYTKIPNNESDTVGLRLKNLKTNIDSVIYRGRFTEIFVKSDTSAISYIHDFSHYNQSIYSLPIEYSSSGIEIGDPVRITDGKGYWHAHHGTWFPSSNKLLFVRDKDNSNIYEFLNLEL